MNDNPISKFLLKINSWLLYLIIFLVIVWILSFVHCSSPQSSSRTPRAPSQNVVPLNVVKVQRVGPNETKSFRISNEYSSWISVNPTCIAKFYTYNPNHTMIRFQYRNGMGTKWIGKYEHIIVHSSTFRVKTLNGVVKLTIIAGRLGSAGDIY